MRETIRPFAEPTSLWRLKPLHAAIRARAFELFEARGGGAGDALSDWLRAEHELTVAALLSALQELRHRYPGIRGAIVGDSPFDESIVDEEKEHIVNKSERYIVTADGRRAVMHACRPTPDGAWHLEEIRSLESTWENLHEHHRPVLLGRGPSANAAQHSGSPNHEAEEMGRRFARDVGAWMNDLIDEVRPEFVAVFAPSRFVKSLRAEIRRQAPCMEFVEAELAHLRPGQLAAHPEVLRVLTASVDPAAPR
ncbi:MAG: host attachment protein [Phycisphaerales bacterium]